MSLFSPKPPATPDTNGATTFTDPRDGNVYRTVKIGNQVWMAENLRYNIESSWCYDNDEANCQKYGRLYTWDAAKKACPVGWHLPTREEWDELVLAAGSSSVLKAKNGWYWNNDNNISGNGTDDYGFSALPGGNSYVSYTDVSFEDSGYYSYWWTATEYGGNLAYYRYISYYRDYVGEDCYNVDVSLSVRCVKD